MVLEFNTETMIRVAIIGGKIHSGGKKNLIMEYYRHIDRTQVQFDFICDSDSNSIPDDEIKELGGRVYRITPYEKIIGNMRDMSRLFKQNNYDIVHGWNGMMDVFAMFVAKIAGCKVRISESISMGNTNEKKTYIKYALRPFSSLFATHFMANGVDCGIFQFGRKAYDQGKIAIFKTVIDSEKNAFDANLREKTRRDFGWTDKIVYGFIGRYVPQKNPIFLMDVFGAIAKKQANAHFVTIGFGELEDAMIKRSEELQISDRLQNLGRREDIQQFYNAFDAFLLPSLYEGLPVVGIEAQCAGLPIFMSTEVPKETKASELAYFMELGKSPEEWADMIISKTGANIPIRSSHDKVIKDAHFDSRAEAERLTKYYIDTIDNNMLLKVNTGGGKT